MNLFHRHPHDGEQDADTDAETVIDEAEYDAQADLALPTAATPHHLEIGAPFAGSVDVPAEDSGYDVERDIGE